MSNDLSSRESHVGRQEPAGDVLVFLTGREEIDQALQQVADRIQTYAICSGFKA